MEIKNAKKIIGEKVKYKETPYLLNACILRKNIDGYFYQAELKDLKAKSSLVICKLSEVEEI